jgi:hypothetical protein
LPVDGSSAGGLVQVAIGDFRSSALRHW